MSEDDASEELIADVGRRIAEVREQRGWTQQEAAEILGMPLKNLQWYEQGANMTLRTLSRIATGLGVPVRKFFDQPKTKGRRAKGRPKKNAATR